MRLCVIDIETTSLVPEDGYILEIAAKVVDLPATKPEVVFEYHTLVKDTTIRGDHYALSMHSDLLREIDRYRAWLPNSWQAAQGLAEWVDSVAGESTLVPAGANVGSFDIVWLKKFGFTPTKLAHRSVEIGNLFIMDGDPVPPGLGECFRRAFGHNPARIAHRAEDDVNVTISILNEGLQRIALAPTIADLAIEHQAHIERMLQAARAAEADQDG